jgi:hypothetical protein
LVIVHLSNVLLAGLFAVVKVVPLSLKKAPSAGKGANGSALEAVVTVGDAERRSNRRSASR